MLRTYRVKHIEVVAAQVEALFAAELPADPRLRRELVQAVTMASTWGSWSILRQHMGLGVARARAVMTRTLTALLSADGPVGRRTPKGRT